MVIENNQIKEVGEFTVLNSFASNNFAHLYNVEEKQSKKKFSLKAIKKPNNKYQVNNEIHILKCIKNCHNILRLYKVFKEDKKLFFVYEPASNGNMKNYIKDNGVVNEFTAITILEDIIQTLKDVHALNIIHNDIKAENIYMNGSRYCLSNWSSSKQGDSIKTHFISRDKFYNPPELYKGATVQSSDIYALGATLYYLLTGKEIFDFCSEDSLAYIMYANCKLNVDLSGITSHKLKYLILMMLHKEADKRATLEQIESVLKDEKFKLKVNTNHDSHLEYKKKGDVELYTLLSTEHIPFAQNNLALLYEIDSKEHDIVKAFSLYERAAKRGLSDAIYHLGQCYEKFFENEIKAFVYYKQAAIFNHPEAIYDLAHYYEKGIATAVDKKKALQLYFEAANHGNLKAYKKLSKIE